MKFTIIKSCLARFSGIFALGTPSSIYGTAISYRCAEFGAFVNSVTIMTLTDQTIPCIPRSRLCPTTAIIHAFSFPPSTPDSQAFNWVPTRSSHPQIFTYALFLRKLRDHLSLIGVDPKLYAGHSFRRGGASFAYQSGVPIELIKALGDWRSDTILIYLTMPLTIRLKTANILCNPFYLTPPNLHTHITSLGFGLFLF